ncbi:radical SAM protein [Desulfosarcina sp. OttesenSCG-928-A07]|nr:radical SAM protein [Desulfosarcina sp. OttesenSCG-928-A07]
MRKNPSALPAPRHLVIPLFIPQQGCPHHCIFCNQRAITGAPFRVPSAGDLETEVNRYLAHSQKHYASVEISFFGGNFLGLPADQIQELLALAAGFVRRGHVHSIRFSTRPDTIFPHTLDLVAPFPVSTIELGVQSMQDAVLDTALRGHRAANVIAAARQVKARGYRLGLQMMVGLPADDAASAMDTARQLALLEPDFVRIYPTLVLKDSPLAELFYRGRYQPLSLGACITQVKALFLFFRQHPIPVARMGLQASDTLSGSALVAGPYHPSLGHLVHGEIALDAIFSVLKTSPPEGEAISIAVHPRRVSRIQGLNQRNLTVLRKHYPASEIRIHQDETLDLNQIRVGHQNVTVVS